MTIAQSFVAELKHEAVLTRKTLERTPPDRLGWAPHPKSFSVGSLASHLATIPSWGSMTLATESLDINPPGGPEFNPPVYNSPAEAVAAFDKNVEAFSAALSAADDAAMLAPWSLLNAGQVAFTMPRVAVIRSMIMNHIVHHRAQLGLYLRLLDLPVPAIYGPSADEQS